ncbi:MAG: 3D-(3,5/4)-trihydroxycyclohexane-1,2-dione acylhydrolase (decyclizing), partial [Anaerolinea sp.]|nr:3D-(3,5/4)-trihydroxycyclohexane-1,2-dione acylhydrolase (decyclizing) [Anaerolinea sp.]
MAFDYPAVLFEKRVWTIPRNRPDLDLMKRAADWIRAAQAPVIIAGGGVHYSEAWGALRAFSEATGIPVTETQAGKGSQPYDYPLNLGAVGATGTEGANIMTREADLIIGIGTRYSDFTSASQTAFQNPDVRFININVAEFDAYKQRALPLVGDAKVTLDELRGLIGDYRTNDTYRQRARDFNRAWDMEVHRIYNLEHEPMLSQGEVVGMVNSQSRPQDVVLCAAGSLPGDLHKLWRTRDPRGYHLEYGFSTMGYEIAGGMGVKLADPAREVYVMVGDASFLMLNSEIVTLVQEGIKVTIIVIDNHGFASIGGLSKSLGSDGFGTKYRFRSETDQLDGDNLPIDYAQICAGMGAHVFKATTREELSGALEASKSIQGKPVCIITETDRRQRVGGYESWWDVAVAEVSTNPAVQEARQQYEENKSKERYHL